MSDNKPMTNREFLEKVVWEGGVFESLHYGLVAADVERGPVRDAWAEVQKHYNKVEEVCDLIDELCEEYLCEDG